MQLGARGPARRLLHAVALVGAVALVATLAAAQGIGAGRAAALGDAYADFTTQPLGANVGGPAATGQAGVPWSVQPVVSLVGDWDPALAYLVDLGIDPSSPDTGGPGRLSCSGGTTLAMTGGVAAFQGCRIDVAGQVYRLIAIVTPYDPAQGPAQPYPATSLPFDIAGGGGPVAAGIGFTTQPLGATYGGGRPSALAGRTWPIQPVVSVLDAQGDVVTADSSTIVLLDIAPGSPQAGGPGTLSCASGLSARVHRGVARFSGCAIDAPGTYYQLRAQTYSTGSTRVLTDISLPFDIGGGNAPARARFTTEPLGATLGGPPPTAASGTPWAVQPVVSILDASGRLVRNDNETVVTIAIDGSSLPTTGRLDCAGGTTVQVLGGVAAFAGCQIGGAAGGYVLRATARAPGGALTSDLSLPFTITAATSSLELSPSTLTVGPGGSVTLTATLAGTGSANQQISFERDGPDGTGWVTVGTSPTDGSGTATFSTTVPYTSGFRAVFAGSGSLAAATSAPDTVAVAARVTLAPGTASVKRGTTIRYVAVVAPVPLGAGTVQFHVWRYVSGSWAHVTQRSARVAANGTTTLSWTWATAGRWRIAAITPTTASSTQGRSRVIPITVR